MLARFLTESKNLFSNKNLIKLIKSDFINKIDYPIFFKNMLDRPLTEDDLPFSKSFYLTDGKLGNYFLSDEYFICSYAILFDKNKIVNQVRTSYWTSSDGGFYATPNNNLANFKSPSEARNLISRLSKDISIASKYNLNVNMD